MHPNQPTFLGQHTIYPTRYAPDVLEPIARALGREGRTGAHPWPYHGVDEWTAYELSWLDLDGRPRVGMARFFVPCSSSHIVESKSLKLYLFSLNHHRVADRDAFAALVCADLERAFGGPVTWQWVDPNAERVVARPAHGLCLDDAPWRPLSLEASAAALGAAGPTVQEHLYTDTFRSLCPVTAQPDWATLGVIYRGPQIDRGTLLSYLCAFREHQDFHERCVESIFMDILAACGPQALTVYARYTRRGGLDINPLRSTAPELPVLHRAWRQ